MVERQLPGIHVVILDSSCRTLVRPFVRYLELSAEEDREAIIIVLLPEHMPRHFWERFLYNQHLHRIRQALVGKPNVVVLVAPYRRK